MRMGRSVQARWGMCGKVRDGEVAAATCSVLQDIMGYLDFFSSAATSWGCLNKQPVILLLTLPKRKHSGLVMHDCGLFVF